MLTILLSVLLASAPAGANKKPTKKPDDWLSVAPASSEKKKKNTKQAEPVKQAPQEAAKQQPQTAPQQAKPQNTTPIVEQAKTDKPKSERPPNDKAPNANVALQLAEAKTLFSNLEYDRVVPIATAILARDDANIEQRLDAYMLQGSSLAIIGDAVEAEKPFRFLLRGRPDYEMSVETSPKILAVFRKVQVEEKAIVAQMHELERARMMKALQLSGEHPQHAAGGAELLFEYSLKDPFAVVEEMKVAYRKKGEPSFSTLALKRDDVGVWRGTLAREYTASDVGFTLEYYLTTADARGVPLIAVASVQQPLSARVDAGAVEEGGEIYEKPWFWVAAAATVVLSGVAGVVLYQRGSRLPETDLGEVRIR